MNLKSFFFGGVVAKYKYDLSVISSSIIYFLRKGHKNIYSGTAS